MNGEILPRGGVTSGRVWPAACAAGLFSTCDTFFIEVSTKESFQPFCVLHFNFKIKKGTLNYLELDKIRVTPLNLNLVVNSCSDKLG